MFIHLYMDIVTKTKRSFIMSKVPQKQSKQELLVSKFLFSKGYRYRKNYKTLPGSPDIAITKQKIAIFVHGCFWHGHLNCQYSKRPTSNIEYWEKKIDENIKRDNDKIDKIEKLGWKVIIIWQCELKNSSMQGFTLNSLLHQLKMLQIMQCNPLHRYITI
jgi:DNA mismatch endonuclease, patch repair protein